MNCEEARFLLDGFSDGELDLVNHVQVEMHLDECSRCMQVHRNNAALAQALSHESLYHRAPAGLRERVVDSIEIPRTEKGTERWSLRKMWLSWAVVTATCVLAISIVVSLWSVPSSNDLLAQEFTAAHVRSLMVDHLTDVASTDQHTVKPWFDGHVDFAPPVIDLGAQDFALIGGRLDYVGDRTVAALVFKRRQHMINLFIFPDQGKLPAFDGSTVIQGYNLIHWNKAGMEFWAVSDLNIAELKEFSQLYRN